MVPTNPVVMKLPVVKGNHMLGRISKFMMAAGAAATVATGAMIPRPASADTTSTILTAAAAIGAIVLYSNYQHKQAQANQVVGYTRNGGTVYGDGRVVMPDGQTYYPNSNGQYTYNNGRQQRLQQRPVQQRPVQQRPVQQRRLQQRPI